MSNLIPSLRTGELSRFGGRIPIDHRTGRALAHIERQTRIRMADVQGHAMVQTEKVHEIDRLTCEAMGGQAMLNQWAATLAQGDPFLADDLKFFRDIAKMGKGEIIADTVSDFCQEGRR
jgi:hypothetical protein